MKNNKFVSLSDFKNTLVINGFNGEMIEKAEHKVHKYLRKEGGKYIYDYDKMNAKEHEDAAWEHHVQHIVNDTKAEGRKMAKDKELEEHYRKHAAYHKEEKEKHTKLAEEKTDEMISKFHKIGDKLKLKGKEGEYEIRAVDDKGVTLAKVGEKNSSLAMVHNVFREKKEEEKHTKLAEEKSEEQEAVYQGPLKQHNGKIFKVKKEKDGSNTVHVNEERKIYNVPHEHLRYLVKEKNTIKKSEAFDILIPNDIDEILEKSRNEHNKPIGQTQSGKNVYHRYDHPEHKSFTKQDHTDAAQIHEDRAYLQYGKAYSKDKSGARTTGNNNRNAYGKMNYSQKQQAKHEAAAGSSENNE